MTDAEAALRRERFIVHPLPFARGRLAPLAALATVRALRRLRRAIRPAVVHHVSLQGVLLGLLAAHGDPTPCVNSFTGLGFAFTSQAPRAQALRVAIGAALRLLLRRANAANVLQNPDDLAALAALGIPRARMMLIRGSGVDTGRLQPLPEPSEPLTVGFVGRLLEDKGIRTLLAAHRLLRAQGRELRLIIAGTPDPSNPTSVSQEEAASWNGEPGIAWLGQVADIASVWAQANIAVLPSRREGLPLSLLEAAACGRALIAADVPGCREIVVPGETGILVPVDDPAALAAAIGRLADDPALRAACAAGARRRVVENFSAEIIGRQTVALYRRLIEAGGTAVRP